jgi:predicted N-acetyltransferase YhbS
VLEQNSSSIGKTIRPAPLEQDPKQVIRTTTAADAHLIRSLIERVGGLWQPWWSDETLAAAIAPQNTLSFVWDSSAHVLGFICAHDLGFRAYLSELVVDDSVRHQGIGTLLVQAVETALRARGQRVLIADVWRDAEAFYRALGWEPPDVVLLRKRL